VDLDYAKENNYQVAIKKMIKYFVTNNTKGIVVTNNY